MCEQKHAADDVAQRASPRERCGRSGCHESAKKGFKYCSPECQTSDAVRGPGKMCTSAPAPSPLVAQVVQAETLTAVGPPADEIWFYERHEPFYEFTNFFEAPIVKKGRSYATSEHFFQSHKFEGILLATVMETLSAAEVEELQSKISFLQLASLAARGDSRKVMESLLVARAEQHAGLYAPLEAGWGKNPWAVAVEEWEKEAKEGAPAERLALAHPGDPDFPLPVKVVVGKETREYATVAEAFRACRSLNYQGSTVEFSDIVRQCPTCREVFELPRSAGLDRFLPADWHKGRKDEVMKEAVMLKFTQHPALRQLLFETGTKVLVEHTTNDDYWGDGGGGGKGKNRLGEILVEVRAGLAAAAGWTLVSAPALVRTASAGAAAVVVAPSAKCLRSGCPNDAHRGHKYCSKRCQAEHEPLSRTVAAGEASSGGPEKTNEAAAAVAVQPEEEKLISLLVLVGEDAAKHAVPCAMEFSDLQNFLRGVAQKGALRASLEAEDGSEVSLDEAKWAELRSKGPREAPYKIRVHEVDKK